MILQGLISVEKTKDVGPFGVGGFGHGFSPSAAQPHDGDTIDVERIVVYLDN